MHRPTRVSTEWRPPGLKSAALTVGLLAAVFALFLILTGPVSAAPQEPTMTLARLSELLAASPTGTVDAAFKTTAKGAAIVTVPCVIDGIVPQAAADNGDLIMFRASGSIIEQAGGIAAGMSGSPVYVDDGGAKLVGAVSYGESFTSNGLGLATPIGHMMALESDFQIDPLAARLAKTVGLSTPVVVGTHAITKVVVAPTAAAARDARRSARTAVMRPLSVLQIGGVPEGIDSVKALKTAFAREGVDLRAGVAGGAAGSEPDFETPLVPGSSVGELFMRGSMWFGGVGTTTYTTADGKLVAFGHPGMYDGYLSAFMVNADVIGLWNNAQEPHKVVAPGKVRGAITVDSGQGIAGVVGDAAIPAGVPFTSTATNCATGKRVTTTSYVTQWAADQYKSPFPYAEALSLWPAMFQATGDQQYDGHLEFVLTIKMTDGSHDYTITRTNSWEDSYGWDATYLAVWEVASYLSTVTQDPDGTINPHITSVDLESTLSPRHSRTRVADVSVPGGLHTGANTIRVTTYPYGQTTARTVDVPLTIPRGMSTKGAVYAKAPFATVASFGEGAYGFLVIPPDTTAPPRTLADVVAGLDLAPGNDRLLVAYDPRGGNGTGSDTSEPWSDEAVTASVPMDTYLTGSVSKSQADVSIQQTGRAAVAGRPVTVQGELSAGGADLAGATVEISTQDVGATTGTLLAKVPVLSTTTGGGTTYTFTATIPAASHSTTVTATWEGNGDYVSSSASTPIEVKAVVDLRASVARSGAARLTAKLRPADSGGRVAFMVAGPGGRTLLRRVDVGADGTATCTWKPGAGSYHVVARFLGSDRNAAASSRLLRVAVL